ncbi:Catenin-beta-like protein [Bombardia bombarda]|uniref:Catenin-beta-like protein n=1 Tax=Bombardia bombarda TaxID=252184 RepID=A0AA39WH96_9PEZI|nr:Catenin-beta-like protein [Bombardia bombarda]
MTSIDDIFKKSGLPSKRKLDPVRDPTEIYKSAKTTSRSNGHRHAHISPPEPTPQQADDNDDDDIEAGPAPPPQSDDDPEGDYGPSAPPDSDNDNDEDEEGRFFGGGISAAEKEILDFMDTPGANPGAANNSTPEIIDLSWLKKTALTFEKLITRNAELRARFEASPSKFIDSEADLDAAIKTLSILAEHPELYADLARLGCVGSLVSLLAHDNTDIAIDAVEIIGELTDEDVPATDAQWSLFVDALLDADLLGLLVSNFARLDETQEADRAGVYLALGVVESLCSRPSTAELIGKESDVLLRWLLARAQRAERPTVTQNKQYAAEIIAILVQSSAANRRRLAALGAVDVMLQLVAAYRKRDPEKSGDEEEYMENLFEALTCIVDEPEGKTKFVEAEGVELCLIMLKEGKLSKAAALRLLDHAAARGSGAGDTGSAAAAQVCSKVVEEGGLKTMFTMFMKGGKKQQDAPRTTEHLVGIFASMLRLLPADSAERIRTLAKFVEKDYEKTEKLVKLRREYGARVAAADGQIAQEQKGMDDGDKEDMADDWFSRRLDAGLFSLQTIDVILAWLIAEDDGARKKIQALLADRDETVAVIRATIQQQIGGIDADSEDGKDTRAMLSTLVEFLQ